MKSSYLESKTLGNQRSLNAPKKTFSLEKKIGVGIETHLILSKNEASNVRLWDYAGQERFGNMLRVYILPINLVALFVDLTNIEESIKAFNTFKRANIREEMPCVLIYTKSDLVDTSELTDEVIDDHRQRIAESLGIASDQIKEHFITSAKDGTNIDKTLQGFIKLLIRAPAFNPRQDYTKEQPHTAPTFSRGFFGSLFGGRSHTTPSTNQSPPPIEYQF